MRESREVSISLGKFTYILKEEGSHQAPKYLGRWWNKAELILTIEPSHYKHSNHKRFMVYVETNASRLWVLNKYYIITNFKHNSSWKLLENDEYCNKIIEIVGKMLGTSFNLNNERIGCLMLAKRPEKYLLMIIAIEP